MTVLNIVQAVNHTLRDEMKRSDKIVLLGEDVGVNRGVFRATEGLFQEFGPNRVIDTPLAESGIIGVSIGMALYGLKPVQRFSSWISSIPDSTRSKANSPSSDIALEVDSPCRL